MPELRWALLLIGILFLAGLALWELRKQRNARLPRATSSAAAAEAEAEGAGHGNGSRTEPVLSMETLGRHDSGHHNPATQRDPIGRLPVVEIVDPSVLDNPSMPAYGQSHLAHASGDTAGYIAAREDQANAGAPVGAAAAADRAAAWLAQQEAASDTRHVRLDWPPEDQRQIVALRLTARDGEVITGAALRQALVGEGFEHGEFEIFHKALGDGRVIVSAASLMRPGTFALAQMDTQMFAGLNLFCVLPGPLPHRESFERLLQVGRTLAQRIRGVLCDAKGRPLTDSRISELRREVAALAQASESAAAAQRAVASSG